MLKTTAISVTERVRQQASLSRLDPFHEADEEAMDAILMLTDFVTYEAGDTIVGFGQFDGTSVLGLVSGSARITRAVGQSGEIDVDTLEAGGVLGFDTLLAGYGAAAPGLSLSAEASAEVAFIEADALEALAGRNPGVARVLLQYCAEALVKRSAPPSRDVSPERRVHRYLLSLVRRAPGGFRIPELPRHASVAEAAGVADREAAEAVSRLISGGIAQRDYPGLQIVDIAGLRRLAY